MAVVIVAAILIIVLLLKSSKKGSKKQRYREEKLTGGQFEQAKSKMKPYCSKETFDEFMAFLRKYEGGYIRWQGRDIIFRDYLGKEKGDLKGIFFNIIVPNPNISVEDKESYRAFMLSIGVKGVDDKPLYEVRDSKLRNKETNEDDYIRKEVGNIGERGVREVLGTLDSNSYYIINGPVLKYKEDTKEFDHIVVGASGLFIVETKAFGMTDGESSEATLVIDKDDKWIINKGKRDKELVSPTEQIMEQKRIMDAVTYNSADVKPILALSNTKLQIKQNAELPYKVIRLDELTDYILSCTSKLSDSRRKNILEIIDDARVN